MRLGIDFGTTRTVIAAVDAGRYPVASFEVDGGYVDWVPGHAAIDAGRIVTGWEAAALLARGATGVRSVKRAVSALAPEDEVPGLGVGALELATAYATSLLRRLREQSNLDLAPDEPVEAMMAVPANASSRQRYLTLEAFRRAGFRLLGLVNEPTAAGIEYAHRNLRSVGRGSPKKYVVVYDLGGGTFDTAAVSLEHNRFELLESDGVAQLGGEDFDEVILEVVAGAVGEDAGALSDAQRSALLEACREAKERLSPNTRRMLIDVEDVWPASGEAVVDTAAVYERAQPLIARTLGALSRVFASLPAHGVDPDNPRELGAVYLVGGAVAFPPVARALRELHGRKVRLAPSPHAATAVGLAVAADPEASVFVRESVTRHFGVWREAEAGRQKVFDPILRKDDMPPEGEPVVVRRVYRPAHAVGHLRFLECSHLEDGEPAGDLTPWRELFVAYDPSAEAREDRESLAEVRLPADGSCRLFQTNARRPRRCGSPSTTPACRCRRSRSSRSPPSATATP